MSTWPRGSMLVAKHWDTRDPYECNSTGKKVNDSTILPPPVVHSTRSQGCSLDYQGVLTVTVKTKESTTHTALKANSICLRNKHKDRLNIKHTPRNTLNKMPRMQSWSSRSSNGYSGRRNHTPQMRGPSHTLVPWTKYRVQDPNVRITLESI